jgi:hypothetical protein
MERKMRKILTLFTALAVALVFAFLISASPPTMANAIAVQKNMKVLIVGDTGIGANAAIVAKLAVMNIPAEIVESYDETPEIEAPDIKPFYSKPIFVTDVSDNPESIPISERKTADLKNQTANYRPPTIKPYTGFDNPARGKI